MNTPENFTDIKNDAIDIVKEVRYYTFFWPWFLACVFLMSITVFVYLRYSSNTYASTAIVQVKDANSDPSSFLTQTAGAMFNFNRVKIDNFITQITAKPNIKNVVKALDLQTNIYSVGRVKTTLNYGQDIPFEIDFKTDITLKESIILKVQDDKPTLEFGNKDYTLTIGQTFELEDFRLTFNDLPENDSEFLIVRTSETAAMAALSQSLTVSSSSEEGDNIEIAFQGPNIKRNEAIINSLIETAHADQVNEKRQIYALSIDFINSRLSSIVNEIDSLSLKTTGFKSNNLIFSPEVQTSNALSSLTDLEQEKFNLTTQLELARSLQQNLQSQLNFSLLPSNIGINSGNVNELVVAYNTLVLERNGLLSGATERNPIIVQLSTQLTDLKKNILSSIDNYLENLETSLTKYKEFKNTTSAQVAKIPKLEATLLAFERKFQIAENLYLFLLQKREEASISYEATLPDTRVINHAYTNPAPVAPKRSRIFIGAILLGFLLPFGVLYILKITDSKIHTREDLEKSFSNLDILGEIPYMEDTSSLMDARGGFAESARTIRSNISYKLPEDGRCKVILVTSSIKGEGKTLNAFNMANSYVCSGKKVLLIGADLRNPQIHNILGYNRKSKDKGLSSLLVDSALNPKAHISKVMSSFDGTLDILYSGPIPPNPAELLGSKAFTDLLDLLKNDYDYIFIDSAPLLLVSDSIPMIKYADLVLYTTRADYTDKKIAPFVLKLIKDKEIKNFGLVLNGIKTGARSYYQYGYSYRYSYAYQYNYGYGYGYGSDDK